MHPNQIDIGTAKSVQNLHEDPVQQDYTYKGNSGTEGMEVADDGEFVETATAEKPSFAKAAGWVEFWEEMRELHRRNGDLS